MYKVGAVGMSEIRYEWIRQFLNKKRVEVRVGKVVLNTYIIKNGAPQGSVISPTLFNIMINDLSKQRNAR